MSLERIKNIKKNRTFYNCNFLALNCGTTYKIYSNGTRQY